MPRKAPAARVPLEVADAGADLDESEAGSTAGSDHAGSGVELEGADVASTADAGVAAAVWADDDGSDADSEQGAAEVAGDGQGGALLAAAADYLALEQPVVNSNEPVMAQAMAQAPAMAQTMAQAPALAYRDPAQLILSSWLNKEPTLMWVDAGMPSPQSKWRRISRGLRDCLTCRLCRSRNRPEHLRLRPPVPGCGYRAQPCGDEVGRSVLGTEVRLHPCCSSGLGQDANQGGARGRRH